MKKLFYLLALIICASCSQPQKAELQRTVNDITLDDSFDYVKSKLDTKGTKYKSGTVTLGGTIEGKAITVDKTMFAGNSFEETTLIFIDDKLSIIQMMGYGKTEKSIFESLKKSYKEKYPNNIDNDSSDDLELTDDRTMIGLTTIDYPEYGVSTLGVTYANKSVKSLTEKFRKDI